MNIEQSTRQRVLVYIFISLTAILMACGAGFYINEVITHPQFDHLHAFTDIADRIKASSGTLDFFLYKLFFIADLIWAPLGLALIYRWIKKITSDEKFWTTFKWSLIITSCLAFGSDILENVHYFFFRSDLLGMDSISMMKGIKTGLYGFVLLHLVIAVYQEYLLGKISEITGFIKASALSLIVVVALGLLLTGMEQGGTVIVALHDQPINILAMFLLLNALAMACSHYPDYIQMSIKKPQGIQWHLTPTNRIFNFIGLGLVTYSMKKQEKAGNEEAPYRQVSRFKFFDLMRKHLGTLFLFTWIFVLLFVFQLYVDHSYPLRYIIAVLLACIVWLIVKTHAIKAGWQEYFRDHEETFLEHARQEEMAAHSGKAALRKARESMRTIMPRQFHFVLNLTQISFFLLGVGVLLSVIASSVNGWHPLTWSLILLTSMINIVWFVMFRNFRTAFSYYRPRGIYRLIPLYWLGNDLNYVKYFASMGYVSLMLIIYAHYQPSLVNALPLIFAYLYLYYGFVVIPLKHAFYYRSTEKDTKFWVTGHFFRYYLPFAALLLVAWTLFMGQQGNGLHLLKPVEETETSILSYHTIADSLSGSLVSSDQPLYLLASYGGGLRANAWTMFLLHDMAEKKPELFNTMGAISGVSGGFLGAAMFTAIRAEQKNEADRRRVMEAIASHNFLSIDVSYLLGYDFIRELIPKRHFSDPDRAGRSMQEYASLIQGYPGDTSAMLDRSFKTYWSEARKTTVDIILPPLIGNTTGTHGRHGVVFSPGMGDFNAIFPGADNILNIDSEDSRSIRYLDAVSTTNRFPIFSPTGQIRGKGHYLDGGYFENSGLLSLVNFYHYYRQQSAIADSLMHERPPKIIQIINSKEAYIRKIIRETCKADDLATGELPAILNTVSSIDILPGALEAKYRQTFRDSNFIQAYLPYPVHYDDVVSQMRGEPCDPLMIEAIITKSNTMIDSLVKSNGGHRWGVVPPPLARVLSEPAVEYMKAMMEHPEVRGALSQIYD